MNKEINDKLKEIIKVLEEVESGLYSFNARVVSLRGIALDRPIRGDDLSLLNKFIGNKIKDIRDIKEKYQEELEVY
jgi:hypothetical protein